MYSHEVYVKVDVFLISFTIPVYVISYTCNKRFLLIFFSYLSYNNKQILWMNVIKKVTWLLTFVKDKSMNMIMLTYQTNTITCKFKVTITLYTACSSCVESFLQRNERHFIVQCKKKSVFFFFFFSIILSVSTLFLTQICF